MRMSVILPLAILVAAGAAGVYFFGFRGRADLREVTLRIGETSIRAEVAETIAARAQGLSGRDGLGSGRGMLFLFDRPSSGGFWMKDMKFPIDIVWIKDGVVLGITENVSPEPGKSMFQLTVYYPPSPVDRVLELPAGEAKTRGILPGTKAVVE